MSFPNGMFPNSPRSMTPRGVSALDLVFHAEAFAFNEDSLCMVEEPVEQRGSEGTVVVEYFRPVLVGSIRRNSDARCIARSPKQSAQSSRRRKSDRFDQQYRC